MSDSKAVEELLDVVKSLKEKVKEQQILIEHLETESGSHHNLTNDEITRYSRQIFVDLIGVEGQVKLKGSRVLIVGCGGLGCPATQYLAGLGIGCIGLVDYDEVELNNLHRQVLHSETSLGISKVESLAAAVQRLNSNVSVEKHSVQLSSSNALSIIQSYDVVLDATDNVATRYLLSDACVLARKPLVSGAAVKTEGQLTVYCYSDGPCYRCLFREPPPPQSVANCGDVGVLSPVPGVIGVMQALQAVHILLGNKEGVLSQRMLLFDGEQTQFRSVKLRGRSESCPMCGVNPTITSLIDYEQFCGSPANDKMRGVKLLEAKERATVFELKEAQADPQSVILDVRTTTEFQMCRIPRSINIPLTKIEAESKLIPQDGTKTKLSELISNLNDKKSTSNVYVLCRRGNDSQIAVTNLRRMYPNVKFVDIIGGLHTWTKEIDPTFPKY